MPKQRKNKKTDNTKATTSSKADETELDDHIQLRVLNETSSEVHFRVRPNAPLLRLKMKYCKSLGLPIEDLRFVFDGQRITDEDTAQSLSLNNFDVIEVYQQRTGGHQLYNIA